MVEGCAGLSLCALCAVVESSAGRCWRAGRQASRRGGCSAWCGRLQKLQGRPPFSAPEAVAELSSSKLSAKKESLLQFSKSRKSSCRSRERAVSVIDKQRSSSRVALDRLSLPLLRGARAFELRTTGAASQAFGRALDWKALSSTARALGARRCALPFCPATAGALPLAVFSFSAFASSCAWQKTHAQKAQVARKVCLR